MTRSGSGRISTMATCKISPKPDNYNRATYKLKVALHEAEKHFNRATRTSYSPESAKYKTAYKKWRAVLDRLQLWRAIHGD